MEMDEEGWVPIEQLLDALHGKNDWKSITQEDIQQMQAGRAHIYEDSMQPLQEEGSGRYTGSKTFGSSMR